MGVLSLHCSELHIVTQDWKSKKAKCFLGSQWNSWQYCFSVNRVKIHTDKKWVHQTLKESEDVLWTLYVLVAVGMWWVLMMLAELVVPVHCVNAQPGWLRGTELDNVVIKPRERLAMRSQTHYAWGIVKMGNLFPLWLFLFRDGVRGLPVAGVISVMHLFLTTHRDFASKWGNSIQNNEIWWLFVDLNSET